jgi:SAM-dependent methyltransferase
VNSPVFRIKDWLDCRFFKRFVAGISNKEISVLDVGGGAGQFLSKFKKMDARIKHSTIVDIDDRAGVVARQLGHEYYCGTFEEYQPGRTFEIILMLNLIEHVDSPKALIKKAKQQLSPGGLVILKTPNADSLDARLFRHSNWGGYHCPRHWVLFERGSFEALLQDSGLGIRLLRYTQGAPFWATSVLFAMSRRGWIHISIERPALNHPLYPVFSAAFAALDMIRGPFAKTSQMLVVLEHI